MGYIDFHSHAFPDELAATTVSALAKVGNVQPALDGTTADLLQSMARTNIDRSVICSIATRPQQFAAILAWSRAIASEKLIPLASIHPDSADIEGELAQIKAAGLAGIKLHPFYQDFFLGDPRLEPIFKGLIRHELLLVMHCGYDIGFPEERRADPGQLRQLIGRHPELQLVAAHLGSWQLWHEVESELLGEDIYLDLAFALPYLDRAQALRILENHRPERLLFGSDSPWADQGAAIAAIKELGLAKGLEENILWKNGDELLAQVLA
ncbi:MAG: amidohydrolase family protein [Thermodesulfobacteriota bacterium]